MEKSNLIKIINSCIDTGDLRINVIRQIGNILYNLDGDERSIMTDSIANVFKDLDEYDHVQLRKAKDTIKRLFRDDIELQELKVYFETTILFFLDMHDEGIKLLQEDSLRQDCRMDLTYEALGFYLITKKEFSKAIEAFDNAIVANSKRKQLCLWGKGNAYKELNDFFHSEIAYKHSMIGNTTCIGRAISSLSRLYAKSGNAILAVHTISENFDKHTFLPDDKYSLLFTQIENYTDQEMYHEIKDILDLIDRPSIADRTLQYKYDRIYLKYLIDIRDFEKAEDFIDKYESAIGINIKQRNKIRFLKAKMYALQDKISDGLKVLEKILETPENETTYDTIIAKANLLIRDNKTELALKEIDKRISTIKGAEKERTLDYLLLEKASVLSQQKRNDLAREIYLNIKNSADPDVSGYAQLNLASLEYEEKNTEIAKKYFTDFVTSNFSQSFKAKAHFELAKIAFNEKDYKKCSSSIEDAKKCDVNLVMQYKIGILEYHLNYVKNDYKSSLEILEKLAKLPLNSKYKTNIVLKKSRLLSEKAHYDQAIEILNEHLSHDVLAQEKSDLLFELGTNYISIEQISSALKCFTDSAMISSSVEHISYCNVQIGICHWINKNFLESFKMHLKVITTDQESRDIATVIASSCIIEKINDNEAINSFKELLTASNVQESEHARILLSRIETFKNRHVDAEKILKTCKFTQVDNIFTFFKYVSATNYYLMNKPEEAKASLQEAENKFLSQDNDRFIKYTDLLELFSKIEYQLKNYEKAKAYLEKAVKKGSRDFTKLFTIDEKISAELKENSSNIAYDLKDFITSKDSTSDKDFNPITQQQVNKDKVTFNLKSASKKGAPTFDHQIKTLLKKSPEIACHYSTAETALFYILPSPYNHNNLAKDMIDLRFTPLGQVNDIEEGEFYLDSEDEKENVFALKKFNEFKTKIKRNVKIMCFSWSNERIDNVDFPNAPFLIPPMWSHYSSTHSGVCLIFNLELLRKEVIAYCEKKEISIHKFQRVVYSYSQDLMNVENKVTSKELFSLDSDLDIKKFLKRDEKIQSTKINTFFLKPPDWNYEREFRFMIHDDSDGYLHVKVPANCITGIVIGKHLKSGYRSMLETVCQNHNWFLMSYDPRSIIAEERLKVLIA